MNRRDAVREAENNTRTVDELLALIRDTRARDVPKGRASRVNPGIPLEKVLDILEAPMAQLDGASVPQGWAVDPYTQRQHRSKVGMIIQNILRECA